jgi:hypothetical protein
VHEPNSEKTGGLITAISSGSHFRKEKKGIIARHSSGIWKQKSDQ